MSIFTSHLHHTSKTNKKRYNEWKVYRTYQESKTNLKKNTYSKKKILQGSFS